MAAAEPPRRGSRLDRRSRLGRRRRLLLRFALDARLGRRLFRREPRRLELHLALHRAAVPLATPRVSKGRRAGAALVATCAVDADRDGERLVGEAARLPPCRSDSRAACRSRPVDLGERVGERAAPSCRGTRQFAYWRCRGEMFSAATCGVTATRKSHVARLGPRALSGARARSPRRARARRRLREQRDRLCSTNRRPETVSPTLGIAGKRWASAARPSFAIMRARRVATERRRCTRSRASSNPPAQRPQRASRARGKSRRRRR